MSKKQEQLYHIHRLGNQDHIWYIGNEITIDQNFNAFFAQNFEIFKETILNKHKDHDLDSLIKKVIERKLQSTLPNKEEKFNVILNELYILRREIALEEGRKLYNPSAPSRIHSLFLTDKKNIRYWKETVGQSDYKIFVIEPHGEIFISSDLFFPNNNSILEKQIEESKEYWQPKIKKNTIQKEYIFKGRAKIIK